MSATGLQKDTEPLVAQCFHQRKRVLLQQRFTAGQFHQGQGDRVNASKAGVCGLLAGCLGGCPTRFSLKRRREPADLGQNFLQRFAFAFSERVRRIAIRTPQIARRQPDKNARQAREGALTLQTEINFIDDQTRQFQRQLDPTRSFNRDRNRNLNRSLWIAAI